MHSDQVQLAILLKVLPRWRYQIHSNIPLGIFYNRLKMSTAQKLDGFLGK